MMNGKHKKTKYLVRELWILAWNASVQHASLYRRGVWQSQRDQIDIFKNKVINHIKNQIISQYKKTVEEFRHVENIEGLIRYANESDTGILGANGYKFGVAQKVLNLALKYYWCLGQIKEPPHCPVDKIVIDKTVFKGRVNWTQILTKEPYLDIISAITKLAQNENCSIAQWELNNYERWRS